MMRGFADEMANAKYAHIERERRWRVDRGSRPTLDQLPFVLIEDLYIAGTRLRLRVMTDSVSGAQSRKLTKKYDCADPRARPIVTAYLEEAEHALLARLPGHRLAKRRYRFTHEGAEWSLDCFLGPLEGLELLEIEASEEAALEDVRPLVWAAGEVTFDPHFAGVALAAHGLQADD